MLNIKAARQKAHLTQKQMSEMLGIPQRTIENWDGGLKSPPKWAEKLVIDKLEELSQYNKYADLTGNYASEAKAQYSEIVNIIEKFGIQCGSTYGSFSEGCMWYDDAESIFFCDKFKEQVAEILYKSEKNEFLELNEYSDLSITELLDKFKSEHDINDYIEKVNAYDFNELWAFADNKLRIQFVENLIEFKTELNQLVELIKDHKSLEFVKEYGLSINVTNFEERRIF